MRSILYIVFIIVVYYAVKTVARSALKTYGKEERNSRLPGDEMVLDPECHTYILKERAITRRINNRPRSFCSEACAKQYEEKNRT